MDRQGVLGDTKNYGHGKGSAYMKVELHLARGHVSQ